MDIKNCVSKVEIVDDLSLNMYGSKVVIFHLKDGRKLDFTVAEEMIVENKNLVSNVLYEQLEKCLASEATKLVDNLIYWLDTGRNPVKQWQAQILDSDFDIKMNYSEYATRIFNYPAKYYQKLYHDNYDHNGLISNEALVVNKWHLKNVEVDYSKDGNDTLNLLFESVDTPGKTLLGDQYHKFYPVGYTETGFISSFSLSYTNKTNSLEQALLEFGQEVNDDSIFENPKKLGFTDSRNQLGKLIPNIVVDVACPACKNKVASQHQEEYPLTTVIISLNDQHQWTREQIADWLDTLDIDLKFRIPDAK